MQEAPELDNEIERLQILRALGQLDTQAEERFDRIVEISKLLFNVPIALITLVDVNRQWFKANRGLGAKSTARSVSFCGHAIAGDDVMVVEDTLADERFDDNPLVNGEPFIRFYAGAPLTLAPQIRVGTLCIIDTENRSFTTQDRQMLMRIAGIVRDELLRPPAPSVSDLRREKTDQGIDTLVDRIKLSIGFGQDRPST